MRTETANIGRFLPPPKKRWGRPGLSEILKRAPGSFGITRTDTRYMAYIILGGRQIHLGSFRTRQEAAIASHAARVAAGKEPAGWGLCPEQAQFAVVEKTLATLGVKPV